MNDFYSNIETGITFEIILKLNQSKIFRFISNEYEYAKK